MKIAFATPELPEKGVVVLAVAEDRRLAPQAAALDAALGGALGRAMAASRFRGRKDQTLAILAPAGTAYERIVLAGFGKPADLDPLKLEALGAAIQAHLAGTGHGEAAVVVEPLPEAPLPPAAMAAHLAIGARLRSYRFGKYFTREKEEEKPALASLILATLDPGEARRRYQAMAPVADAVAFTRDLVSEPANVVYPESLAEEAKKLEKLGIEVDVLGEKEMKKLGMGALLGVGQGSERESQLVVLKWWGLGKPDDKEDKKKEKKGDGGDAPEGGAGGGDDPRRPLAFIGKGVTFDTGGISIKPSANMEEMKWDMAGAAAVIGAMRALAGRAAKVNAVGVVGLVENMPSGTAQRPGDVVTTMSGQTVEVINTDAEGRLVLADALHYVRERYRPRLMVDLATLTGAVIIALGSEYAGLFASDDELAQRLCKAGDATGERLWRLPLGDAYDKEIKSDIADMKNVGNRGAGSITAAQFLKRFVGDTPWAHLDIAGVAWAKKDRDWVPKGATGFGVRLLDRFVADFYEAP